jgi:hypothetical protein
MVNDVGMKKHDQNQLKPEEAYNINLINFQG